MEPFLFLTICYLIEMPNQECKKPLFYHAQSMLHRKFTLLVTRVKAFSILSFAHYLSKYKAIHTLTKLMFILFDQKSTIKRIEGMN